jgi:hypothetical protein
MKKFIIENAEVYTVQYEVSAESEEEALTRWENAEGREIDKWQLMDLSEVRALTKETYKKIEEPTVYEDE